MYGGEGLRAGVLEECWVLVPALPLTLAMHLRLVYFAFLSFSFLASKPRGWNDLQSLTAPPSVPRWPVLFADPGPWVSRGLQARPRPQWGGEAGCRCATLYANVPSLMGWCWQRASLHGKKSPSNYTAVLWWLRAIMGKLCRQSTPIHKFHRATL